MGWKSVYTAEEKQFIIDLASNTNMTYLEITEEFNKKFNKNKTGIQIKAIIGRWEIKRPLHYTKEEKQFIIDLASNTNMTYLEITEEFNKKFNKNKTEKQIKGVSGLWGIKRPLYYTEEEKQFIIDLISNTDMTYLEITEEFNKKFNKNKTEKAIFMMTYQNGIKKAPCYTEEEKQFIIDLASNTGMTYLQIAQEFNKKFNKNKTDAAIQMVVTRIGIKRPLYYTEEEKQFIIDLASNTGMTYLEITEEFNKKFNKNKTEKAIRGMGNLWGVKRDRKYYTEEERNFIIEMIIDEGMDYYTLAPLFNKKFNKNKTNNQLSEYGSIYLGIKCHKFTPRSERDDFQDVERKRLNSFYKTISSKQEPIGTIKCVAYNRYDKYMLIKIKMIPETAFPRSCSTSKSTYSKIYREYWYPYDKYVYEHHYNVKLKDNECIQHLDGNILNNDISNLISVSTSALHFSVRNGYYNDPETRSIGFKLGELRHLIKQGEKEGSKI